jgi:hypothetical protein
MKFSLSATEMFGDAASRLKSLAREMRLPQWRHSSSRAQERLHDLASALDQFVASTTQSLRSMREASAPYLVQAAETAGNQADLLQNSLATNLQAAGKQLAQRRGLMRRHPFIIATAIVGTGYFAVRKLMKGAATRPAQGASRRTKPLRAKAARPVAATRSTARTRNPDSRTRRKSPGAAPTATETPKAVH